MAKTEYCVNCGSPRAGNEGPNETNRCTPCLLHQRVVQITKETYRMVLSVIRMEDIPYQTYRKLCITFIIGRAYRKLREDGFRGYIGVIDIEQIVKDTLVVIDA